MDKQKTQYAVYHECISTYQEVASITELLLEVEEESERTTLVERRGTLIQLCESKLSNLSELSSGASSKEIEQCKSLLQEAILKAVTLDKLLQDSLTTDMAEIQSKLNNSATRNRAVTSYGIHSHYGKL